VAPAVDGRLLGWAVAALLAVSLVPSGACATPGDPAVRAARQLFADAEKDEDAARWAEALGKLRRVAQVKLTAGIHYHIALCQEHLGQLAAALDEYTSAEGQARGENAQDVLVLVGKRIEDLGPRVPRLTLRLAPHAGDATVILDGTRLAPAVVGTALPVDPGEHTVEVTVADGRSTAQHLTVRERDVTTVDLPVAAGAPPPPPPPAAAIAPSPGLPLSPRASASPPAESPTATATGSRAGAVLATVGAVVLAGGGVAAFLLAASAHRTAVEQCSKVVSLALTACDPQRRSVRDWDFAAAGAWLGAALVGTVAVVAWAQGSSQAASATPSAQLFMGPGWLGLGGRF
jgi:hypothetical protein